jgi:hypothetical protein
MTSGRPLRYWRNMLWVTWRQHRATLTACHPFSSSACQTLNRNFNMTDWTIGNTVNILLNLAPALAGAFAGGRLLARELETGTYRYSWTQGFGRARWAIAKLTIGPVSLLRRRAGRHVPPPYRPGHGGHAGRLHRARDSDLDSPAQALPARGSDQRPIPYANGPTNPNMPWVLSNCTSGHTQWASYIPVSRFWPMQFVEGGWLLALSILLIAATTWLVRRRAA